MSAGGRGGGEHGGSGDHGAGGGNGAGAKGSGGMGGGGFQGGLNGAMGIPQWAQNRRYPMGTFGSPAMPQGMGMPAGPVQPQPPIYHPQQPMNPGMQYLGIPGPSPYGVNIMGQNPQMPQQPQLGHPAPNPNMANPWLGGYRSPMAAYGRAF